VVIGFDDDKDQIIFHAPYFGDRTAMTSKDFMKVWELVVGGIGLVAGIALILVVRRKK
jgi:hypothetical protein